MKFVFFGTPEFAAKILEALINAGYIPSLVVCNPDRPVGRKKIVTPPPTKIIAQKYNIPVWQPEKLSRLQSNRGSSILEESGEINKLGGAEFAIDVAYAKIIPKEILDTFPAGVIGVHPSLLPKYRGPAPIQAVILDGGQTTGVTLYLLDEKMDHGPILAKRGIDILPEDNYKTLHDKLSALGAELLIETLPKFISGEIVPEPQDHDKATFSKKFSTEDGYVSLDKDDPEIILRKIRALNPEPGVYTFFNGERVKLLDAELVSGELKLKKIQKAGKKPKDL